MPIILCRHGATAKNIEGGTDDGSTPLHETGIRQARESGVRLRQFCEAQGIGKVQPITSGFVRTEATCDEALRAFGSDIDVLPRLADERIGEIKFRPREIVASAQTPGLFGRVIAGASLEEIMSRLTAFSKYHLADDPATLTIAFGHRTTHRALAMIRLGQSVAWMEALPRMDNCELWLLRERTIEILHPGYPAARDGYDARRKTLSRGEEA